MEPKGIKEFQQERSEIIINFINQSCVTLLEKGIDITGNSVTKEVIKNFERENIDAKYLVSSQTIGRNKKYSLIWKKYKKKQKEKFLTKHEKKNKELEFSIRDKYDMLKQEYIELSDNYTYLFKENKENISKIQLLKNNIPIKNFENTNNINDNFSFDFFSLIKEMLLNGSVVILEKDDSIVIKNLNQKDDNKITINKNKWNNYEKH